MNALRDKGEVVQQLLRVCRGPEPDRGGHGGLHVGPTRHRGPRVLFGKVQETADERQPRAVESKEKPAGPQPERGQDLVVSGPSRVDPLSRVSEGRDEVVLDRRVHVLVGARMANSPRSFRSMMRASSACSAVVLGRRRGCRSWLSIAACAMLATQSAFTSRASSTGVLADGEGLHQGVQAVCLFPELRHDGDHPQGCPGGVSIKHCPRPPGAVNFG